MLFASVGTCCQRWLLQRFSAILLLYSPYHQILNARINLQQRTNDKLKCKYCVPCSIKDYIKCSLVETFKSCVCGLVNKEIKLPSALISQGEIKSYENCQIHKRSSLMKHHFHSHAIPATGWQNIYKYITIKKLCTNFTHFSGFCE